MSITHVDTTQDITPYYVYALFCHDSGPAYVKFGYSKNILARVSALRTGMPIPLKLIAFVQAGTCEAAAASVESEFHKQFITRNSNGEWFKFDLENKSDKDEFNSVSKYIFGMKGLEDSWWIKVTPEELQEAIKQFRKDRIVKLNEARKLSRQRAKIFKQERKEALANAKQARKDRISKNGKIDFTK